MKVLVLDNYDSFTFNLAQLLGALGVTPTVIRSDRFALDTLDTYARIVISPGSGRPDVPVHFGVCAEVIVRAQVPLLGVCLGHQGIGTTFGGRMCNVERPRHGTVDLIEHDGSALFAGIDRRFPVMRYNSLLLDPPHLPRCLRVTASSGAGEIMAIAHRERPIFGVQFHPESIGTPDGRRLMDNFLRGA